MGNEGDVFEWRRLGHWKTGAAKARFAAYVLWHMYQTSRYEELARECGHQSGDAGLALLEAFSRESAVALELVVKAVIANNLRASVADSTTKSVPATHDLPKLWKEAGLPDLSREDLYRLQLVKSVLMWSGRYSTPRTVKAWERENRAFDALEESPGDNSRFVARTPITLGWEEFDRLYQIACKGL